MPRKLLKRDKKRISRDKRIICPDTDYLYILNEHEIYKLLTDLFLKLDDLGASGMFGDKGWRAYLGYKKRAS